jgi:AAA family ATP:ADP antiporter
MKDRLFTLLGIEPGEESMVSMLLTQSVFLGIFFGTFDISAHSLFLSIFDEKMMARGYVVSGLAGIILTTIYTRLQTRLIFREFATINLIFVTLLTFVLWFLLLLAPSHWVVFMVFILLGPLNILAMLGFWGTTGRIFTLRQGKRLFNLVDAGLIIGIIISCYAIPMLLSLNFKSHNILLISAAALMAGSVIQMLIGKRFLKESVKSSSISESFSKKRSVFVQFRYDRYIRIMGIFIALSVMTAFFVQYSFMAVTREQYPAEVDMARFLGFFIGSMMIFTLLIKLLVFSYLIRNYGLKTCLVLSPVLVAAFTVVAVLIGMLMGYTPASSGFMLFFMLLALSRLFSRSLKDSIELPSCKVIYQTIDENIRFEVQSGLNGTVNEIAALSSGLLLAFLGIISFIKLIHFSLVLFIITILWVLVATKLYSGYRKSIREALESGRDTRAERINNGKPADFKNRFAAGMTFRREYFDLISGNKTSEELKNNELLRNLILEYADAEKDINLLPVVKSISADPASEDERQRSLIVVENLKYILSSVHKKFDKILDAQKMLADSRQPQTTHILRLLREKSVESRKVGIYMIGKFRFADLIPEVCSCLNNPETNVPATAVLKSFGNEATQELERYFMKSSGNTRISKTILQLLGDDCRIENMNFLFLCLWSSSRQIREIALKYLISCKFKAPDEDKDRLHQLISDVIGVMVWNLSARISLQRRSDKLLLEALELEIAGWNTFLFNLLSITYDPGSVQRIRENLESGTVESLNFALEIIDIVIDEVIKPKLIPLLDIISDEEKVKSLYQFYPGEVPVYDKLVEDIINRDYNLFGIWIRACAIRNIPQVENENLAESLVALMFSPEIILQEESARLINRSGKELYKSASRRLPEITKERLDRIVNYETFTEEMVYEKVMFLSGFIPGASKDNLLYLAESLEFRKKNQFDQLAVNGYIMWSQKKGETDFNVEIIYKPTGNEGGNEEKESGSFYYLPLKTLEEFLNQNPEFSNEFNKLIEASGK